MRQLLKENDINARLTFEAEIRELVENREIDLNKVWFSDEAHFYLHGYVNRQNFRIWGTENPHVMMERPLHPDYLTVWMAISGTDFIGPCFFYETVNGERYQDMLENFFFPEAEKRGLINEFWFQQDGATAHRTSSVKNSIRARFGQRVIGLGFESEEGKEIAWPPHSPDLNPCDFVLWGMMKDYVYRAQPTTLYELKNSIESYTNLIDRPMLERIMANFQKRLDLIPLVEGAHFENIIN